MVPPAFVNYLEESNVIISRDGRSQHRKQFIGRRQYLSGPTLSARKDDRIPPFSYRMRNANDFLWIEEVITQGFLFYCADYLSFSMFRSFNADWYTWKEDSKSF